MTMNLRNLRGRNQKSTKGDFAISATKNWTASPWLNHAPVNTEYATKWAVRNFTDWVQHRNADSDNSSKKRVPNNLLDSCSADDLNHWLSLYVVETRNKKGELYPPKTLYQLLTGLHRHALSINPHTPNFLDKISPAFRKLHNVIGNHFKALRKDGIGSESKHTEIITKEEENRLGKWSFGLGYLSQGSIESSFLL